MISEKTSSLVE